MKFEEIAKKLSEEEGVYISPYTVCNTYYIALNKLRRSVSEEDRKMLLELIADEPKPNNLIDFLESVVQLEDEY